jgi:3-oxoacyl-[acyl-carrier protein] reductase
LNEKKLEGQVAAITGAARGLGRSYALRIADLGADVAIIDRNLRGFEVYDEEKEKLTAPNVMKEIEKLGCRSIGITADLGNRDETIQAIEEVVRTLGRIDILICNASGGTVKFADEGESSTVDISTSGTASNCSQETLVRVFNNNLMSCLYSCIAVAPHMKKQRYGRIVTVASQAGLLARSGGYFPYGTAKAAIIFYTRKLAWELGSYGINVNCIAPGFIATGRLMVGFQKQGIENVVQNIPHRRLGTVEDCAKVVEFLVTDLSDYVTGQTIAIGFSM